MTAPLSNALIVAALLCVLGVAPAHARPQAEIWCESGAGVSGDEAIAGCTTIIEARRGTANDIAAAHLNRGFAYRAKNRDDRALRDFDAAIRLKRDYANALFERGFWRSLTRSQ